MNHNIDNMEHMQNFIIGLKSQARKVLDASAGGTIRTKNKDNAKILIEKMCQNECRSQSERGVKTEENKKVTRPRCSHKFVSSIRVSG